MSKLRDMITFVADCIAIVELSFKLYEALRKRYEEWKNRRDATKCEKIMWRPPYIVI